MTPETVGANFSDELLEKAASLTLQVLTQAASQVQPGMNEGEARALLKKVEKEFGVEASWHRAQVRLGSHTALGFGVKGEDDPVLKEDDIFFFDLGLVFDGHEGDVGRTFFIGKNAEMIRASQDVEVIWKEVRDHWRATGVSGKELYQFAETSAEKRGWTLSLKGARGHRIADFPHAARQRGTIARQDAVLLKNRWILEIQIIHPSGQFGAFFEDLLN